MVGVDSADIVWQALRRYAPRFQKLQNLSRWDRAALNPRPFSLATQYSDFVAGRGGCNLGYSTDGDGNDCKFRWCSGADGCHGGIDVAGGGGYSGICRSGQCTRCCAPPPGRRRYKRFARGHPCLVTGVRDRTRPSNILERVRLLFSPTPQVYAPLRLGLSLVVAVNAAVPWTQERLHLYFWGYAVEQVM